MNSWQYKCIIFDFDGIILDSMAVRDRGFEEVLKDFDDKNIALLLKYHRENGGLSRYNKFRYFYEEILGNPVSEEIINNLADRFSKIMKGILTDKSLLIQDSLLFIKKYHKQIPLYIASGSDQKELRYLCEKLDIGKYFIEIYGSPTPKPSLIKRIVEESSQKAEKIVMIGDAYNDKDAAESNGVVFWGYNNSSLNDGVIRYIKKLSIL